MCSTVCENAITDSASRGRHGEAEDEKKATAGEFPICASTAFKLCADPAADLHCYIAILEQDICSYGLSTATYVRDQLRKSTTNNFEGREYITRPTLLQVMSKDIVHCLFQQHVSEGRHLEVTKQIPLQSGPDIVGYVEMEAKVLLALCIFIDAPMPIFIKLLEAGICDSSLPLTGKCPTGVDKASFVRILESQWIFLPHDVFAQPGQVAVPAELVLPLIFDKNSDLVGSGAHSDVFRVRVDNGYCSSSTTRERASMYALKKFKADNPYIERSFRREYSVLQELAKIPHGHIVLQLAAWSQGGVFYMIFPQARCNLRTFMGEVEYPGLTAKNVVWFFKQLRGLVDAVRHIHALKPLPALYQFRKDRPIAGSDQAACHNDIKPENILVFDSEDDSPGVFKISDFGCGKVVCKDRSSAMPATEGFYGTPEYESPDLVTHKEASEPNDVWALGCVFLELLDWFTIPTTDKQMTFQSQRYTGPGPTNPAFWYRNPENKFQLKPQVGQKLMDLEKTYCFGKYGLERVLNTIWFMIAVDLEGRWTAERVYNDLNHVTRQAMLDLGQDPGFYLRPGRRDGGDHLEIAAFPELSSDCRPRSDRPLRDTIYHWEGINALISGFKGYATYRLDQHLVTLPPQCLRSLGLRGVISAFVMLPRLDQTVRRHHQF